MAAKAKITTGTNDRPLDETIVQADEGLPTIARDPSRSSNKPGSRLRKRPVRRRARRRGGPTEQWRPVHLAVCQRADEDRYRDRAKLDPAKQICRCLTICLQLDHALLGICGLRSPPVLLPPRAIFGFLIWILDYFPKGGGVEIIDDLQKVWPLIELAPWSFTAIGVALLAIGWASGRFMFSERVQTLKERVDAYREKLDGASPDEARRRLYVLETQVRELSPRRLTTEQIDAIARAVSVYPGEVHIAQDMAAADARTLAAGFAAAFGRAGWQVKMPSVMGIGNPPPSGIALKVVDAGNLDDREKYIRDVLNKAGISFDIQPGRKGRSPQLDRSIYSFSNDAELLVTTKGL
ncbi:hypothetical protein [Aquamicrobium sp. LC103]|uniref:hypothetical protein n=1 Tax=Aquamicrobium sp. LC103 TaxID=1120658 RepID=UPI000AC2B68C|nr:hypothetical protein [Aquamicrobium sp. LC103]TKT79030.1 hypothetical protein XW59_008810 [Aquamicrobium sp. LC103]